MSLVATELIYLSNVVTCSLPYTTYIIIITFVYYVCHCNFDFFVKFVFTFKNLLAVSFFQKINLLLTYLLLLTNEVRTSFFW